MPFYIYALRAFPKL